MKILFTLIFSMLIMSVGAQNYSWTAQESGTPEWLNDVQFVDNMHGWAVGDNGTIVATVDGGETWSPQTSGTTEKLRSVFFLSDTLGWIAGGFSASSNVLLMTEDGGANWTQVPHDIPNEETMLKGIQFYDADHGFTITSSQNIYYTSNGGINWEKGTFVDNMSNIIVNDLYVISDTSAFLCGKSKITSTNQTRPSVFDNIVHYAGEWARHGAGDFTTGDELTAIHFTDNLRGFVGGRNGKIYTMEADENIFPNVWYFNFDSDNGTVWSIDFADNDHGMFNTATDEDGKTIQLVYHTSDAGETWSSTPDSIPDFLHATLSAGDTENAWLAGSAGQIFKGEPKDPTSVSDHASFDFSISPNPFISSVRIESPESYQGIQLSVFSYTGQVMKSVYLQELQESYELEGLDFLTSGVYFIHLNTVDGKLNSTRKIVKF